MILFLDFDGVLHREFLPGSVPGRVLMNTETFTHLALFESVLREYPSIEIVISSTWRARHSLGELQAFFAPDIAQRIIGVTPALPKLTPARREKEIRLWLQLEARTNDQFLAVDDWPPLFGQDFEELFWVNPETAFDHDAAAGLRERLDVMRLTG